MTLFDDPRAPTLRAPSRPRSSPPPLSLEIVLARVGLVALGLWHSFGSGVSSSVTIGDALMLVCIPIWFGGLRRARSGTTLLIIAALAVANGLLLSKYAAIDHTVGLGNAADTIMQLFGVVAGAGFVLWCSQVISIPQIGLLYGLGMIGQVLAAGEFAFTTDGWKRGLAVASAVVVLALAARCRTARARLCAELSALTALALASAVLDSRSYLGTFLLTAVMVACRHRPWRSSGRTRWPIVAVLMGTIAIGIYEIGTSLLVDGYLGRAAQVRSVQQLHTAGSLILGGRPELGATIALFEHRPIGFGTGVVANAVDVRAAKVGLAQLNYNPNNGYVDNFMFGSQIELHSVIGDLWAHFGFFGIALTVMFAFVAVRALAVSVAARTGSALLFFLCAWTLWNLLFSPALSAAPALLAALGLGLACLPRKTATAGA